MAYTPPDLSIIVELEPDYTPPDLSIAVELDVGDTSEAYAVIGLGLDAAAVGWRDSEAAATVGLGLDEAAGWAQPLFPAGLWLALGDDPPRNWPARELSGYHRPLSGEAANLTLALDIPWRDRAAWANPPLGAAAVVRFGVEPLLEGTLTAVSWSRAELNVSVEG